MESFHLGTCNPEENSTIQMNLLTTTIVVFIHKSNGGSLENQKSLNNYLFHIPIYKFNNPIVLCVQHSPPLSQRGVGESKYHSELFKLIFSTCFSEDVCNLLIHGTMSQMNCVGFYMISNQMIFCANMFGSIMKTGILG